MIKKILIAADHAGFILKQHLVLYLQNHDFDVIDLGCHDQQSVDYPDYAHAMYQHLQQITGTLIYGVLVCGTGIGMSMAVNRHQGMRAAVCNDGPKSAFYARAHNDANVLCMGARLIDTTQASLTLQTFIDTPFEGGRHVSRIAKIEWSEIKK